MTPRRLLCSTLMLMVLALGACSSGSAADGEETAASADGSAETTTPPGTTDELDEFCRIFSDLADRREATGEGGRGQDQGSPEENAAAFDRHLATVQDIAAVAPAEIQDQAEAYVEMVEDRAELSADNGGVGVEDLPTDARAEFIASHRDLQAQVNELLDYARANCDGFE